MINCKICFRTFKTLTASHLVTHDIGVIQYKKKFRVKYIHSKQVRKKIGILKLGHTFNRGRKFNFKVEKIKQSRENLIALNKSLKKRKQMSFIMKGNKNAFGLKHSIEFKRKQRERLLGNKINLGRKKAPDFGKKVGLRFKKLWDDPTWRRKMIKAQHSGKRKSRQIR
jgi:hypothetical protein